MRFWDRVLMSLEGVGIAFDAIRASRSGLMPCDFDTVDLDTWIGKVDTNG